MTNTIWHGTPWKMKFVSGNFRWICDALLLPSGDRVSFNLLVLTTHQ